MHGPLSLSEIADEARLVRNWYPGAARDYHKAAEALQSIRDMRSMGRTPRSSDAELERDGLEAYSAHAKRCAECSQRLGYLTLAVARRLPTLWPTLKLVGTDTPWHDKPDFDWPAAIAELRAVETAALTAAEADRYAVTLVQAAGIVSKSKRTLERWVKEDGDFPLPDTEGGAGKPNEWEWSRLRPYLEKKIGRQLPERFPADPFRPDFGALES